MEAWCSIRAMALPAHGLVTGRAVLVGASRDEVPARALGGYCPSARWRRQGADDLPTYSEGTRSPTCRLWTSRQDNWPGGSPARCPARAHPALSPMPDRAGHRRAIPGQIRSPAAICRTRGIGHVWPLRKSLRHSIHDHPRSIGPPTRAAIMRMCVRRMKAKPYRGGPP